MQLTTARLKQIIKEELEELVSQEMADEAQETVDEVDAEIASLEQQLAEAKKAKAAKGRMAAMKGDKMAGTRHVGTRPPQPKKMKGEDHKMTPAKAPGKRHDKKGGY